MPILHNHGIALRYRELGGRGNPPIVFAHSLLWGADSFSELLGELAKDFHLVCNIIEGASHLAGIEKPLEVAKLVRSFLTKTLA